jgi:hypothetical protein
MSAAVFSHRPHLSSIESSRFRISSNVVFHHPVSSLEAREVVMRRFQGSVEDRSL